MYNPWPALTDLGITVVRSALEDGEAGRWEGKTLHLNASLSQAEVICTLAREVAHLEHPRVSDEEAARIAARRVVADTDLAESLANVLARSVPQMCDSLEIDAETLHARLDGMSLGDLVEVASLAIRQLLDLLSPAIAA